MLQKWIDVALCAALAVAAPGPLATQAAAQVVANAGAGKTASTPIILVFKAAQAQSLSSPQGLLAGNSLNAPLQPALGAVIHQSGNVAEAIAPVAAVPETKVGPGDLLVSATEGSAASAGRPVRPAWKDRFYSLGSQVKEVVSLKNIGERITGLGRIFDSSRRQPAFAYAAAGDAGFVSASRSKGTDDLMLRPYAFMNAAHDDPSGSSRSTPPPVTPIEYQPRAAVRGLGVAALFASLLPTFFAIGTLFDPHFHGKDVSAWVQVALLAFGAPLLTFGLRVMSRLNRNKFPLAPGDSSTGTPELAGFLLGLGSNFFTPIIIEHMIGNKVGVPQNVMMLGAMIGLTALSFLGLDALRSQKTSPNSASGWMTFAGYGAGVAIMIVSAAAHNGIGILVGFGVMLPVMFASLFAGGIWSRIIGFFHRMAAHRRSQPARTGAAASKISVRTGVLIGFGIGTVLAIALMSLSPFLALAPIGGVVMGYLLTRRQPASL